jgi:catechol 2,3-dioxygenase-like lactoylglutathione lyase family enzyme
MTPRFDLVGLAVADMARTLAFYRLLGLPVPADADAAPHVEVPLPGGLRLAFDTHDTMRSFDPEWQPVTGTGRVSLAFDCDTPERVDACYTAVTAAGHHGHLAPFDAVWGQRYAVVHDPDGNPVDLFAGYPAG